jgi:TM2 domain-containing membrane protein YozV
VRELLGRATLARARKQPEQALKLVQEAVDLDEADAEAHELKGDLLLELGRGAEAMGSLRRARELRPDRAVLEDKIARAALQSAARQQTVEMSRALLEGRGRSSGPKRNPGYAALLSLIVPGLGQFYNGDVVKGLVMITAYIFLLAFALLAVLRELAAGPGTGLYGPQLDMGLVYSALSGGGTAVVTIALVLLWIYAIGDAALRASKSMTSDGTGLV